MTLSGSGQGSSCEPPQPEGWLYSEKESAISKNASDPTLVCRTPIILTQRLKSMETGEEKIEIAFKRDGNGIRQSIHAVRSSQAVASPLWRIWMHDHIRECKDGGALPGSSGGRKYRCDHKGGFCFYVWLQTADGSSRHGTILYWTLSRPSGMGGSLSCQRTFEGWKDTMRLHRSGTSSGSFWQPALQHRCCGSCHSESFLYTTGRIQRWKDGSTESSVVSMGDPERLMVNFNATQVALERMAGFFNDLPMGLMSVSLQAITRTHWKRSCI